MSLDLDDRTQVVPHRFIEYGYYFSIFYAIMGSALGISIGFLGSGLVAVLAVLCLFTLGLRIRSIFFSIAFPLGCAVSFVMVQYLWHGESLMGPYVRPFIMWMLSLVIVQSLSLRRGFLHRFILVMFFIGLSLLPFLELYVPGDTEVQRMGLSRAVGLANPNNFAAWFGFCSVYFTILGFTSKQMAYRLLIWLIALGCLFLVTVTVSRGALAASAIAIVVASRHFLKKGFVPILFLAVLGFGLMELGVFDDAIHAYGIRAKQDSGRFAVWSLIAERVLDTPLVGVGASDVTTFVPSKQKEISPHNGFLFLALSSGFLPFAFFTAYWILAVWRSWHLRILRGKDAPFLIPMLVYTFLETLQSNILFMEPWAMVAVAMVMMGGNPLVGVQGLKSDQKTFTT